MVIHRRYQKPIDIQNIQPHNPIQVEMRELFLWCIQITKKKKKAKKKQRYGAFSPKAQACLMMKALWQEYGVL